MFRIKKRLRAAIERTAIPDFAVRFYERATGIHYPSGLIGRRNFPSIATATPGVLVIAAHPDDEVLGLGFTISSHRASGDIVNVVFMTNGAGPDWRANKVAQQSVADTRFIEACDALGVIGIPPEFIVNLGFPDYGLLRYIPEAVRDVATLLDIYRPKVVYVHAIEGGHRDHDTTSFVVQYASTLCGLNCIFEWAEYNRDVPMDGNISEARFPSDPFVASFACWATPFDQPMLEKKRAMLGKYVSQANIIHRYPFQGEILRKAKPIHLTSRLAYFRRLSPRRIKCLTRNLPP